MTRVMLAAIPSRIAASVEADNAKTIRDEWHRTAQRVFFEMEARRERNRRRAFWIVCAILAFFLCATAAGADTRREWHGGPVSSWAEIHAPTAPGAVASVTFHDQPIHAGPDTFVLTLDGLSVTARLEFFGGPDGERLHLSVPEGYSVWPEVLEPGERGTGTAHVYPLGVAS